MVKNEEYEAINNRVFKTIMDNIEAVRCLPLIVKLQV